MNFLKNEAVVIGIILTLFTASVLIGVSQQIQSKSKNGDSLLKSPKKIGLIYLYGPISMDGAPSAFSPNTAESVIETISEFTKNNTIQALIIRVNSPGGTVGASQELYSEIIRFKKETGKPVIISIGDVGASGAYWTALAGDVIFANSGSMVGNIGVIMSNLNFGEAANKWGVKMNTLKSGPYKDILSSWRDMTSEDKKILQSMIDDVYDQFVTVLAKSRKLSYEDAKTLADGRIYTGNQAKQANLIDYTGTFSDAIDYTKKRVGIKGEVEFVTSDTPPFQEFLQLWKRHSSIAFNIPSLFNSTEAPSLK